MGALCEHRRVLTTCSICKRDVPRAPKASFQRFDVLPPMGTRRTDSARARSDKTIDQFLRALADYVEREKSASYARHKDNLAAELPARVAAGRTIENVEVVDVSHLTGGAEWAQVRCAVNLAKFRAGSSLLLHRGDLSRAIPARLLSEGELEFRIGAEFRQKMHGVSVGGGWTLDEGYSDYSENLQRALDELAYSPRKYWLHSLLTGTQRPTYDPARQRRAEQLAGELTLDEDQAEAFVRGYSVQGYHLVQGPPGSGKTAVLGQLAASLAMEGQRVLITAVTHRAINHALRKTQALRFGPDVVKVGGAERAEQDVSTFASFQEFREAALPNRGVVVGATCHTRLDHNFFDTVIFDESSQFPIPLAIRGMLYGKRYVFIGDDQQMDPVVVAQHPEPWVSQSIFTLLKEHDPGTMLRTTYRLNEALNAFPSKAFYGGQLRPSKLAASRLVRYARRPLHAAILDPSVPSVIVEVPHKGATVRSPEEARLAAALALDAIRAGLSAHEVGIITPYRAQERLIQHELRRQAGSSMPVGLAVETVERVQGQERDLTIISLTVSDLAYAADAAEFFFRPSRFNVALTRARCKRIVLMDPGLLRLNPGSEFRAWVDNLRTFHAMTPKAAPPRL